MLNKSLIVAACCLAGCSGLTVDNGEDYFRLVVSHEVRPVKDVIGGNEYGVFLDDEVCMFFRLRPRHKTDLESLIELRGEIEESMEGFIAGYKAYRTAGKFSESRSPPNVESAASWKEGFLKGQTLAHRERFLTDA